MDSNKKMGLSVSIIVIGVFSLILNILFLFVYIRRKRLRVPARYFLANLAIVDILAVVSWTSLTAVAVLNDGWMLPFEVCKAQIFFMSFCVLMNTHSLLFLAFERLLHIHQPSRHDEIFVHKVIVIALTALWFFDAVLSVMPVAQWGEPIYASAQFQCVMNHDVNERQMHFMTAIAFGIPLVLIMITYIVIFIRVKRLRGKMTPEGAMILEVNDYASGDSYAARLKKQQLKFKDAGRKRKKPVIGKNLNYTENGYETVSDSSDEEDKGKKSSEYKQEERIIKKVYYLSKKDYTYVKTYLISSILYLAMWYPYVIASYVIVYEFRTVWMPESVLAILVWITHATTLIKPVVYFLHNEYIRMHIKKALCRNKYKNFSNKPKKYAEDDTGSGSVDPEKTT